MAQSTTMIIRITPEIKALLGQLAYDTRRSQSFLASEAVTHYVEREKAIIEGIKRGLDDAKSGHLIEHSAAMDEVTSALKTAGDARHQ